MRFFSQFGDDFLLWEFFDQRQTGYFVDVGAFDGIYLSNTYGFEKEGWTGICIEPNPEYFALCTKNRPESVCVQVACVGDESRKQVDFQTEDFGVFSGIEVDAADMVARYQREGVTFWGFKTLELPACTLNNVLEQHLPDRMQIDFVSIDVEGTELDVLRGFDMKHYLPRVIVVEANDDAARNALIPYMGRRGYGLARQLVVNLYFACGEQDIEKLRSIPVQCTLEGVEHPRGGAYINKYHAQQRVVNYS